jgi:DNA-binding NarL/FixJ family response regulator
VIVKNILLVDDHLVVRAGLRAILELSEISITVEEAGCFGEAMDKVRHCKLDAVVLDISMPGKSGIEVLRQIKKERAALPVLILSVHANLDYGVRALRAGAAGCLDKSAAPEMLLEAIEKILAGKRYITQEMGERLADHMTEVGSHVPHEVLSDREFEVFHLLAGGIRTADVAKQLYLSPKTIYSHRRNILYKLGLESNSDIVRYAFEHHLNI